MGERECLNKNSVNFYSASICLLLPSLAHLMAHVDQAPALLSGCGTRTQHHLARPRLSPPCQHHPPQALVPGVIFVGQEQRYTLSPTASCVPHTAVWGTEFLSRQPLSLQLCSRIQHCLLEWLG